MKKRIVYVVLVLGLGLLSSCQKPDNAVSELTYTLIMGYNGHAIGSTL